MWSVSSSRRCKWSLLLAHYYVASSPWSDNATHFKQTDEFLAVSIFHRQAWNTSKASYATTTPQSTSSSEVDGVFCCKREMREAETKVRKWGNALRNGVEAAVSARCTCLRRRGRSAARCTHGLFHFLPVRLLQLQMARLLRVLSRARFRHTAVLERQAGYWLVCLAAAFCSAHLGILRVQYAAFVCERGTRHLT